MANLTQIAKSLNVPINVNEIKPNRTSLEKNKPEGKKRRDWIVTNDENNTTQDIEERKSLFTTKKPENVELTLKDLRSNPLKIAQYLFEVSKKNIENSTGKLTRSQITSNLQLSKDSVKTAIRFLTKNSLIEKIEFQTGKNGWSKFKITKKLFDEFNIAYDKGLLSPVSPSGNANSSSKKLNNDWDSIDIIPLKNIGLNQKHLVQLKSRNVPEVVQESILHFAFGLKFNPKVQAYENPLAVLIGVLRKGEPWIEVNYKTAQEIAQEEVIKNLQQQKERLQKLQEDAFNLAFNSWYDELSDQQIEKEINDADVSIGVKNVGPRKMILRSYFKKTIWPEKKSLYLK